MVKYHFRRVSWQVVAMVIPVLTGCNILGIELGERPITVAQEEPTAVNESLGVTVEHSPFLLEEGEALEMKIESAGSLTADNGTGATIAFHVDRIQIME